MKSRITGAVLLLSSLLAIALFPLQASAQPAKTVTVVLEDSPDDALGKPVLVALNGDTIDRWLCWSTEEVEGLDRTFNVSVYNKLNQRIGFYKASPGSGGSIAVPAGGYVLFQDDMDKNGQDVKVTMWECE